MTERIWIFGDSYADPNDKKEEDWDFIPWHKRLGKVNNFAKSSTGPHYSLKELYKHYEKFTKDDHIIFIISGIERIHFYVSKDYNSQIIPEDVMIDINKDDIHLIRYDAYHLSLTSESIASDSHKWYVDNHKHIEYSYKTFKDEISTFTLKCESFLYMISRLQQCKVTVFLLDIRETYVNTRLNDNLFYLHNYGLFDASNEEFINYSVTNKFPKYEKRVNHLSEENHNIMEDIVRQRTFKPFKKSFVDPAPYVIDSERFIYD